MFRSRVWASLMGVAMLAACSGGGGSGGGGGAFRLVEFLEGGQGNIPRNRVLSFVFSGTVAVGQDLAERIQIENVQAGANSNFSRAIGTYVVVADRVSFRPRLPERQDRSDAGLREGGNYTVFLKGGADALQSTEGDAIAVPQQFNFDTADFFEDPLPAQPPRALGLFARDATDGTEIELTRLDPRPTGAAAIDNATLIAAGRVIEPGAGGSPNFATPWQFDLVISEPIDPASVRTDTIEMFEIFSDATTSAEDAAPAAPADHFGNQVSFPVPIQVTVQQRADATTGVIRTIIRVTPLTTLVDDTRYRLRFSGSILGIDFRKSFIGDNGLTGTGTDLADGADFPEPGGLGYTAEFIVRDRPAITATRTVTYDPLADNIEPEDGTTTLNGVANNTLYNPVSDPGRAVGFLPAFGDGSDGPLLADTGATTVVDTGDTPNAAVGNPFQVTDRNPNNVMNGPVASGSVTFDSREPFVMRVDSIIVSSSATLMITGVNPVLFRVSGFVQINGTLTGSGLNGTDGGGQGIGGIAGPGGFHGGDSRSFTGTNCTFGSTTTMQDFQVYLNACSQARTNFPFTDSGQGPGRGHAGGEAYGRPSNAPSPNLYNTGTGGGGGSHATEGTPGEDRLNVDEDEGTGGTALGFLKVRNSSVIGVRGQPGPTYGDTVVEIITLGGSGGGGGGTVHNYSSFGVGMGGGGGGGGGGIITIIAAGSITVPGGTIAASGGNGGNGRSNAWNNTAANRSVSGGGGGGSGGAIVLISGDDIRLAGATIDARGGNGGARATVQSGASCLNCNGGGDGGKGFVFLMDADGLIAGVASGTPGTLETAFAVQTISSFDASRFSSILAVTRLFNVLAANPDYLDLAPSDVLATVNPAQRIRIRASSAKADRRSPLDADLETEISAFEVALVRSAAGATVVDITGDMDNLNPAAQTPARDAFARITAEFEYDNGPESALGPFASVDQVVLSFTFN